MKRFAPLSLVLLLPASLAAQTADPPQAGQASGPRIVRLSVAPAAEPDPALKYELLPPSSQRTPGNAASYYYRAVLSVGQRQQSFKEMPDAAEEWTTAPLDQLPKAEMEKWVASHRPALSSLKTAVYREYCDWDWRVQDLRGMETIGFLLPEVQDARQLARVLRVKSRLEIAEGKLDEALETIRQGYQLGHDVAQQPLLINALVGIAIAQTMNESLRELVDQPSAPNLYWGIASLPRPLIDLRPAMRTEMEMPEKLFPFLTDAETAERTPEQWQKLLAVSMRDVQLLGSDISAGTPMEAQLAMTAILAKTYPAAKEELAAAGYDAEQLEKMPVGQVVAIQTRRAMRHSFHEVFKCMLLDYPDSARRLTEINKRLKEEGYLSGGMVGKDPLGLTGLLLPAVSNVNQASVRLARDFAALQAIEAIRMHAAASGKLPMTLEEIAVVPVPQNPATGKLFPYSLDGGEATLEVPPMEAAVSEGSFGPRDNRDAVRYVITLDAAR